jgi:hypothetical protein
MKAAPPETGETALAYRDDNSEGQYSLDDYRDSMTAAAVCQGKHAAELGDPDGFDGAVAAIREALYTNVNITADDVAWPVRGNELGAAFSYLRKAGEIKCVGYAVSRRPKAHGHLIRVWRRSTP